MNLFGLATRKHGAKDGRYAANRQGKDVRATASAWVAGTQPASACVASARTGAYRTVWGVAYLVACCLASSPAAAQLIDAPQLAVEGAGGEFPTDFYVREGEGLEDLRKLEGKPAQEISVAEWRGDETSLAQLRGKIVVLDFWATWCGPCMAVIPKNVALMEKYRDQGVELIGLHDAKSGWDSVDKVIAEKGINYPVALDKGDGTTTKAYNLMFWPTYFVIDRAGIVRGAGIRPDKVEEVVSKLLEESPGAAAASQVAGTFPDLWFLGGEQRLSRLNATQGTAAAAVSVAGWVNAQPDRQDWGRQVKVIQFFRPELTISVDQLTKLQAVADRFAKQGVAFVAVCDARSSADKVQSILDEQRIELSVAMDAVPADDAFPIGVTANAMGVKFAPSTLVVDRRGIVRAAGLKTDFLDKVLNSLLAEPLPSAEEMAEAAVATLSDVSTAETQPAEATASGEYATADEVVPMSNEPTEEEVASQSDGTGASGLLRAELPEDAAAPAPATINE